MDTPDGLLQSPCCHELVYQLFGDYTLATTLIVQCPKLASLEQHYISLAPYICHFIATANGLQQIWRGRKRASMDTCDSFDYLQHMTWPILLHLAAQCGQEWYSTFRVPDIAATRAESDTELRRLCTSLAVNQKQCSSLSVFRQTRAWVPDEHNVPVTIDGMCRCLHSSYSGEPHHLC